MFLCAVRLDRLRSTTLEGFGIACLPYLITVYTGKRNLFLKSSPADWALWSHGVLPFSSFINLFRIVVQVYYLPFYTNGCSLIFLCKIQQLKWNISFKVMNDLHFKSSIFFLFLIFYLLKQMKLLASSPSFLKYHIALVLLPDTLFLAPSPFLFLPLTSLS